MKQQKYKKSGNRGLFDEQVIGLNSIQINEK
jgi:hypothetical protein